MLGDMTRITAPPPLPPRPLDGHKGLFGRVLVVGGNEEMIGAPVLAGTAALRMGSGLVQIAVHKSIVAACVSITPELIGLGLDHDSMDRLIDAAEKADALVVGPGMGKSDDARARVERLIRIKKPAVFDADALNILADGARWPADFAAEAVLTPHPGEMGRLNKLLGVGSVPIDDDGRIALAVEAAKAFGQVMVLKGHRTVVSDGRNVYVNETGNSSLSKAGTGDVLSGMIGSLLGQKMNRFEAACCAVWLHGRAGEIAGERVGLRSVLAREVMEGLIEAIREADEATKRRSDGATKG